MIRHPLQAGVGEDYIEIGVELVERPGVQHIEIAVGAELAREVIMSGELSMPRILACDYRLEKKETPLPEGGAFLFCGAKGTPVVCWYSAVSSAFRNCGYLVGYLMWFFLASFQRCRTYTKGRILSIYQENARRPQERRALSVANNR